MKRIVAILLLGLTLLGNIMDLRDLAKVPRLAEHYQEHRKKSPDVSLLEFLNLHYGSEADQHDKEEHEQHKGLPFKSPDCTFTHTLTIITQFNGPVITSSTSSITYSNTYRSAFSNEFSQSIWQPPRNS
jgi:hypothetical protein